MISVIFGINQWPSPMIVRRWEKDFVVSQNLRSVTSVGPDQSLENVYADFVEKYGQFETVLQFKDMFERIQIKTNSEAVCETIGSIMAIAKSKHRNCEPVNFSHSFVDISHLFLILKGTAAAVFPPPYSRKSISDWI